MTKYAWENFEAEVEADSFETRTCKFGTYVKTLDIEGQTAVESALVNPRISNLALLRGLISKGYTGTAEAVIRKHKSKTCACYRGV